MADFRYIKCKFWSDPYILELEPDEKLIFIWLFTNEHSNQAGIYPISLKTIAFETGCELNRVKEIIKKFMEDGKIKYEENIIWVINFLKHQPNSSLKVTKRIKEEIKSIPNCDIKREFIIFYDDIFQELEDIEKNKISLSQREVIAIRDDFKCRYCGKEILNHKNLEIDHIIPLSKGGRTNYANLVCCCKKCNQKKLNNLPEEVGFPFVSAQSYHMFEALKELLNFPKKLEKFNKVFNKNLTLNQIKNTLFLKKNGIFLDENTLSNKEKKRKEKNNNSSQDQVIGTKSSNNNIYIDSGVKYTTAPNRKNDSKPSSKPPKITFNFETRKWENITPEDIQVWVDAYPACNVRAELKKMRAWLLANPDKRKKNYKRFIINWLNRQQDRGGTGGTKKARKTDVRPWEEIQAELEKDMINRGK